MCQLQRRADGLQNVIRIFETVQPTAAQLHCKAVNPQHFVHGIISNVNNFAFLWLLEGLIRRQHCQVRQLDTGSDAQGFTAEAHLNILDRYSHIVDEPPRHLHAKAFIGARHFLSSLASLLQEVADLFHAQVNGLLLGISHFFDELFFGLGLANLLQLDMNSTDLQAHLPSGQAGPWDHKPDELDVASLHSETWDSKQGKYLGFHLQLFQFDESIPNAFV
mmetsp:Transcript_20294/g.24146  ORF Transcript_20294/g.24146 Transcript_20294/m.24146 type:complete len:220 (+) Transcript_20294:116-775(+)|eukprot:Skav227619  [mRNA]  locus=scaffold1141:658010:663009:+ [translate_table: standard]